MTTSRYHTNDRREEYCLRVLQQFLERCRGHITDISKKEMYKSNPYQLHPLNDTYSAYIESQRIPWVKMECDFIEIGRELAHYYEFLDIMRDHETRHLIDQARFINRLKGKTNEF